MPYRIAGSEVVTDFFAGARPPSRTRLNGRGLSGARELRQARHSARMGSAMSGRSTDHDAVTADITARDYLMAEKTLVLS